jgi:pimeloyl-ACP methyl ester carboxylesterase
MLIEGPVQVHKRLVIYVQGYDPRGLAEYYQMFQREFARTCELYGLTGEVGDVKEHPKRSTANWDVTTDGDGWHVQTDYRLLRWDDIVREDQARPAWWKIVQMYRTIGVAILNGAFRRVLRADWRFGLFAFFPLVLITAWIFLGTFFGILCMNLVAGLGAPELVSKIVGSVTGAGGFASILWLTEPITRLLQRCDEAATTDQLVNRKRKDIEQRMDTLTSEAVDAVRKSNADEVVIVGHGFGSVLAIDLVGRALVREPALGHDGPRVALLTLGANLPVVGFDPEAKWFRNRLRQLAVAPDIDWVDYQSRDDALNFCPFDPVAGHDIVLEADERRNPHVVAISFRDLWKPGTFGRRRWRFFQAHLQYLFANERLGAAFDYHLICCGPLDLMTRATKPQEAITAMGVKNRPEMDPATAH